jgi:hypothetical protein
MALAIPWLFACPMASGQTPITVVTFDITNGLLPYFGSLVQAANGTCTGRPMKAELIVRERFSSLPRPAR